MFGSSASDTVNRAIPPANPLYIIFCVFDIPDIILLCTYSYSNNVTVVNSGVNYPYNKMKDGRGTFNVHAKKKIVNGKVVNFLLREIVV